MPAGSCRVRAGASSILCPRVHVLDWAIVFGLLAVLVAAALRTRRYTRSVPAFLAAGRCGGRYLISVANGIAMVGVITLVWYFEQNYKVGYTPYWWGLMEGPAMIIMALSGWVIYRYRQTRAMTLAQFFEIRYSRRFRVFAGLVAFVSGIINFGIFPSVGARFFIALCGFPPAFTVAGIEIGTYPAVMFVLISIALLFVFVGGLIAVMVTDFIQGIFCNIVFVVLIVVLLLTFRWEQIADALLTAPEEESLVHPFKLGDEDHFNVFYYVISVVIIFYGALGWQGTQGYNCAAVDAHEAKMAGILNGWRPRVLMLIVVVLPVCIYTLMHHPAYAEQAALVQQSLDTVEAPTPEKVATLQNQMRTPFALAVMLPPGLLGLVCAAMLGAFISTNDTYLHSWGSILVQDVILPFRKRPFTPRQHLWLLRGAILLVAVVIFIFSLLFQHTQYLAMFLALTGAVYVGGAGSVIIGGLYWSRGTTAGAWAAMLTGMTLSMAGILVKQVDPAFLTAHAGSPLWDAAAWLYGFTGQEMTFGAIVASVSMYIVVSKLGRSGPFDMDRMLHRGAYAVKGETATSYADARTWLERIGVSRDFTGADRVVTMITLGWPFLWTVIFIAGTIYNLLVDVPDTSWLAFWRVWTWTILACAIGVTVWFTIGGARDMRALFRRLRERADDPLDDGRVEDHRNVADRVRTAHERP